MTAYWLLALGMGMLFTAVLASAVPSSPDPRDPFYSEKLVKKTRKLPGQWCEWTSCHLGKCDPKREGYLTPSQMVETFGMGQRTVKYECWPMKPLEED